MSGDSGTEAEYLSDWDNYDPWEYDDDDDVPLSRTARRPPQDRGGERPQPERWRCLAKGCNPVLDVNTALKHREESGHRVAKWPVRSEAGQRRAQARNRSGYYDRYNVGAKSARARGIR